MKKTEVTAEKLAEMIKDYLKGYSAYRVAHVHGVTTAATKRLLKEAGVYRTQSEASSVRNKTTLKNVVGKYKRTAEHKKNLSELAKQKTGTKNPFFGKTHSEESRKKIGAASKKRAGKRNGNYKHGKYLRRPRDYKIHELTLIRKDVFNRDSHTCQICNQVGGNLHAHHKIPFWVKPEAFLDKDNLITVCTKCHFTTAHLANWACFNMSLVEESLLTKYSLDRERLNVLAVAEKATDAIVRSTDINKTVGFK